jgi:hypothetical protein
MNLLSNGCPFEVGFDDWQEFASFIDKSLQGGRLGTPLYLYRGQSNASWTLRPSLSRIAERGQLVEKAARNQEKRALTEFQAQAHQFLESSSLPTSPGLLRDWWVLMQHYGAATRLLDWTASPYVATYFAVTENERKPGAVWMVRSAKVTGYMKEAFKAAQLYEDIPKDHDRVFLGPDPQPAISFFRPSLETDRMSAQQTYFSVSPLCHSDHADLILPAIDKSNTEFLKVTIPSKQKLDFQKRLRLINVTARTLFPGIDGLGRSITDLIRLRVGGN